MPRKVLVADDSVTIQKVVGITFASEDIELSFVDNGEEAVELARQIRPDLIIADVLMPRKSGYDVCEAVKSDPELGHIPVLLLTGTFEPFDVDRSRRVGADGTITKPFESQTLIRQVNDLLARASSRRDASRKAAPAPAPEIPRTETAPARESEPPPRSSLAEDRSQDAGADASLQDETAAAFEELSRDLGMSVPAPPPAVGRDEAPAAEGPAALDLDLMPAEASFSGAPDERAQAPSPGAAPEPGFGDELRGDDVFEFVDEEGEVLELGEPVTTSRFDRSESREHEMTSLVEDEIHLPPESARDREAPSAAAEIRAGAEGSASAPEGEVWDLSDFEAVEEPIEELTAEPSEEAAAESFWDDAAAEAIDLVESASVDLVDETLLTPDDAALDASFAAADAASSLPPGTAEEGLHASLDALPDLDLDTGDAEPLSLEDLPEPEASRAGGARADFDASSGTRRSIEFQGPAPAEGAADAASARIEPDAGAPTAIPGIPRDVADELVRRAVKDAVEKVTWEAFSDLSETVVKAVKEKVEQIAWEVIPQMAEAMIKEEIRRLQAADEQM
jgi:CheY-like chemotaxis protein